MPACQVDGFNNLNNLNNLDDQESSLLEQVDGGVSSTLVWEFSRHGTMMYLGTYYHTYYHTMIRG